MLLTGQKRGATGFYEAVGFNREDKTGLTLRFPLPKTDPKFDGTAVAP